MKESHPGVAFLFATGLLRHILGAAGTSVVLIAPSDYRGR